MEPRQFRLEGSSLAELRERVLREHGTQARIVAAEKVTVGGIRGIFAREHYEVTVEVPARTRRGAHVLDPSRRAGIAALLADADNAEVQLQVPDGKAPQVSTGSPDFAALMDDLTFNTAPAAEPAAAPSAPQPLNGPGDLVVLVGLRSDPLTAARAMAGSAGGRRIRAGGALVLDGAGRVDDRRSATAARAGGVAAGHSIFVAFGLERGGHDADERGGQLRGIDPDQLWVVVDAGRKPEDTTAWVRRITAAVPVDAVVVEDPDQTSSPETVRELGLPVLWPNGPRGAVAIE